jgi:hypothetical protein
MAPRRALVLVAAAALGGYITWGVINAGDDSTPPPSQVPIAISGGNAAGHRLTTPSWTVLYDHIEASSDASYINARGVRDAVIYRHGKPYIHLTADHIEANMATKDFTATGHLRASQTTGGVTRTFATGTASWSDATQHLLMPNLIHLHMQNATVVVNGMTFDVKTGQIHVGAINGNMHL